MPATAASIGVLAGGASNSVNTGGGAGIQAMFSASARANDDRKRLLRLVWQDPKEKGPSVAVTSFCGEMSYSHQVLVDPSKCSSWESLRSEARQNFHIPDHAQIRFENEARLDLEVAFPNYLTDPPRLLATLDQVENVLVVTDSGQDFSYSFKPELSVSSIDVATDLDHVTAIMELIENALEALLTGDPNNTSLAKVEISFDNTTNSISIKDNGCGMSKDDVHRAINMAQRKAQKTAAEIANDDMLSGRFGRFGVGLKAAFVFGKNVLLRLDSKQADAGGRVQAELDYKQMQEDNVYRGNISLPKSSAADQPGTKITISRIDPVFWKEHGEVNQLGTWSLKPEARKRLAEKYCLYMHGVSVLQRALIAGGHKSGLKMALPDTGLRRQLAIIVEGKDLRLEPTNDVLQRTFALCGQRQRANDPSGSASQDMIFPHPLWHTTLTCTGESGVGQTPGKRSADKNRTVAELVLFFRPKVGEEPAEEDNIFWSTGPSVMVFWQGLYFAEERLDAQVLPWMKKAKESYNKRTEGDMVDACDRVLGFLFLDGSFRPDSHKTRLHMQDEQVKEAQLLKSAPHSDFL
jgi:hypothetical protein